MTASVTVGSLVVLKWKFNTDDTFDMCVCLPKKAWVGIGFGSGVIFFTIILDERC